MFRKLYGLWYLYKCSSKFLYVLNSKLEVKNYAEIIKKEIRKEKSVYIG